MHFRSTMVIFSESMASYSGVIRLTGPTKLLPPTQNQQYNVGKFNKFSAAKVTSKRISSGRIQNSSTYGFGTIHALPAGRDFHHPKFDNDLPQEPFLLTFVKEIMWAVTSLFYFLIEQPSQLKYIEWPGFNTTLKTATLTLVLVMLLIIALSSVDSALSFLLAFFSRRTP